jgi:hypothetical protein
VPAESLAWDEILACREFWFHYYALAFQDWPFPLRTMQTLRAVRELLTGRQVDIRLPKGFQLSLAFGEKGAIHRLYLGHGRRRQLLGWESAHFYPDVFRWSEFGRIVKAACRVPEAPLAQPAAYLLLFTYVGLSASDPLPAISRSFRGVLAGTGLFSAPEVRRFAAGIETGRATKQEWVWDPKHGWILEGDYSLRKVHRDYEFNLRSFRRFIRDYE